MIGTALPLMAAALLPAQDAMPAVLPPEGAAIVRIPSGDESSPPVADPVVLIADDVAPTTEPGASEFGGTPDGNTQRRNRWFIRAGALAALYNSHARIELSGAGLSGASVKV